MTASGHESDSGERVTASGHSDLLGGQGNAYADDVTGSGQKTATRHAESSHGETGIDPRIETGPPEKESAHVESGNGQKTAIDRDVTAHGQRATATMTALDLLTANGKRRESEKDGHGQRKLRDRERALLSYHAPRAEDREPREDNTSSSVRRGLVRDNRGAERARVGILTKVERKAPHFRHPTPV